MGHRIPLYYYHGARIAGTVLLNRGAKIEVSTTNSGLVDRLAFESLCKPTGEKFGYKLRPLLPWSIVSMPPQPIKRDPIDE